MKTPRRDFFKMLGIGGAAVATSGAALAKVKEPGIMPLPTVEALPQAPSLRDPFPAKFDWVLDARDFIVYDSIEFAPGSILPMRFDMFQASCGFPCPHSGRVKWLEDTNMRAMGSFPAPEAFWAKSLHVAIGPDATQHDIRLAQDFAWQLVAMDKVFAEGPCFLDLQSFSVADLLKRKIRPSRASMSFGETKGLYFPPHCYFRQSFSSSRNDLQVDPKGNGLRFIAAMEGVKWRGIQ